MIMILIRKNKRTAHEKTARKGGRCFCIGKSKRWPEKKVFIGVMGHVKNQGINPTLFKSE